MTSNYFAFDALENARAAMGAAMGGSGAASTSSAAADRPMVSLKFDRARDGDRDSDDDDSGDDDDDGDGVFGDDNEVVYFKVAHPGGVLVRARPRAPAPTSAQDATPRPPERLVAAGCIVCVRKRGAKRVRTSSGEFETVVHLADGSGWLVACRGTLSVLERCVPPPARATNRALVFGETVAARERSTAPVTAPAPLPFVVTDDACSTASPDGGGWQTDGADKLGLSGGGGGAATGGGCGAVGACLKGLSGGGGGSADALNTNETFIYKVIYPGGVHIRALPDVDAARIGEVRRPCEL